MVFLLLAWILWCALHSLLIAAPVKRWFARRGGRLLAGYRLGYVIFSIVSLMPLLWYSFSREQQVLFAWHGWWHLPQATLLLAAVLLFHGGTRVYDAGYFLGLKQWMEYRIGRTPSVTPFRDSGILAWVRHPWYSGGLLLLWTAGPVSDVNLPIKLLLTGYFILGTWFEEGKLKAELGDAYTEYCSRVPMLIPRPPQRR
ncbi:MAG: hypothetical protein CSA34_06670 [Desulfobulbus propionicus]|nr:MAG: hypothetical protein CSA34_06670 [Desulfobulbus propionicus]